MDKAINIFGAEREYIITVKIRCRTDEIIGIKEHIAAAVEPLSITVTNIKEEAS